MEEGNYWNNQRAITPVWFRGDTGIPPLDDSILKTHQFGYVHHIERLMVQSNLMLLCEVHP